LREKAFSLRALNHVRNPPRATARERENEREREGERERERERQ
jgi:hypothetical protein